MKEITPTSESELTNIPLSILLEVIVVLGFFTFMYFGFPQLRTTVFGLIDRNGWKYSPVDKKDESSIVD